MATADGPVISTRPDPNLPWLRRIRTAVLAVLLALAGTLVTAPALQPGSVAGATTPTTVTVTYGFDSDTLQNFTVPANVTSLTISATGGQGSWGGADSSGNPPAGGYQGVVSGTIPVTPGNYLTIGVGAGADEPHFVACTTGQDTSSPADPYIAAAGVNPLTQLDGGAGGAPGSNGCSGYGGAGGAATAVEVGSSSAAPTSVGTIVAGGGGGDGGSGQYALVRGQIGLASYLPQESPTSITYGIPAGCTTSCTSTPTIQSPTPLSALTPQGQNGISVFTMCGGSTGSNADQYFNTGAPNAEAGCDGGGGSGGGGGASGGAAGNVQFGSGSSDEWYGQGGSPGQNSTGGFTGLSSIDAYFSDTNKGVATGNNTFADPGAAYDGSVTITYSTGIPATPTGVAGTAGNTSVALLWTAPTVVGATSISDYVVQYSSDGGAHWTTDDTGSTATSTTVTGLTNGTGYIFEVQAVNSVGAGPFSAPTGTVTPSGPPGAATLTALTPEDGGLLVDFTPPTTSSPITGYLYQLNGTSPWLAIAATASPFTIPGLTDGTSYTVEIEAVNASGTGAASNPLTQTPVAVPGAPTVTSVTVGPGSATVAFTPGSTGGSPITSYRYSTDGGATWTTTSTTSPLVLTGLSNGATVRFELEAVNVSGPGAPASTPFTTPSAPAAPVVTSVTPGDRSLLVGLAAPASGGSPLTDYQWSTDGGATWSSEDAAGTPCQLRSGSAVTCAVGTMSSNGTTPLVNGTAYPLEFQAVNAVGSGPASTSWSATPFTTPDAPTLTTGAGGMVPSDQTLAVSYTAPANDGGTAVTAYQYSTDAGSTWQDRTDGGPAAATTMTISVLSSDGTTALANGTTYDVEIRAVNAAGDGPGSAVAVGIPSTAPDAPSITTVIPGNGTLSVTFVPGPNGGSTVTGYQYSLDGISWTPTGSTATSFTISGLTDGTDYAVQVRAVNGVGNSPASAPASGTPATVPSQPVVTATARADGSISLTYFLASNGGSPVTAVQYSTDGGATWSTAVSPSDPLVVTTMSIDGTTLIANGTSYPVELRVVNGVGTSSASLPVNVAPASAPGAPSVALVPGDGAITVEATIGDNGGSPVTGIDYSLDGGPFVPAGTTSPSFTIPGLTNGTSYTVTVRADNAIGTGAPSIPASTTPVAPPGPPTYVLAASDSAQADITWSAPVVTGGSPVTGYRATAYTSAAGTTAIGTPCTTTTLACIVTGLTNGTTYYVGVVATNAAGTSVQSSPLQVVTPIARPGAPTLNAITVGDSYLSVAFAAGTPGGDPITSYQYTLNGGTTWTAASGTSSPITVNGLTDGTSYTIRLRAVSAAGTGATSTNSKTGTPYTYPSAVTASTVFANAQNGQVAVSWTVPGNGGSAITQAQATVFSLASGGIQQGTCTTTTNLSVGATATCTIAGLVNGTTYYVSIQSDNAAGWSDRSTPRVPATPGIAPGAVTSVTGVPGDGQVAVSWAPGSTGGSPITNYTVWYSSGGSYAQFASSVSTATTATVTGLANGTPYTFEVEAVNTGGTGPASSPSTPVTPEGPSITSSALPGGEVGVRYDVTPTATGGTGVLTWSVTGGSLPAGLTLNPSTGEVTGVPTTAGNSTFTLMATDGVGGQATQDESATVTAAPTITSAALPGGELGVNYDVTPVATGGTGVLTWSITGGSLPSGLTLNPSTGEVTGTPTTSGRVSCLLVVTDGLGASGSQGEMVTVAALPVISTTALSAGDVGVAFDATPTVTGGSGPFTWSVTGGTLPASLTLDPSTGELTGTPTASGQSTFTLTVADELGGTASQAESVPIAAHPDITSDVLGGGEVGVAYDMVPTVVDGTGTYNWSVVDGTLPTGLSFDTGTGEVTGTPTMAGTSIFDLVATDALGATAVQPESVTVLAAPTITSAPLGGGEVSVAFDVIPTTTGGTDPVTWSIAGGTLANGLSLDPATGEVTGTPTAAGTSNFNLVVTDRLGHVSVQSQSIAISSDPQITSPVLGGGEVGLAYDGVPSVTDGTGPFTWSISDGTLPAGLRLDGITGDVTGTPTAVGTELFMLTVTDAYGVASTQSDSVDVLAAPIALGGGTVTGDVGVGMSDLLVVQGGTGPYTWRVSAGSLPTGISLSTGGSISGFPSASGSFQVTVTVTDAHGQISTETVVIVVRPTSLNSRRMAVTPDGHGYWVVSADGDVTAFGTAQPHGSLVGTQLVAPIVGIAATPDGGGYWLVASDGGVFAFGDAAFLGSEGGHPINRSVVGMTSTPDGKGYRLVASDGGVFTFGDAAFLGSEGGHPINQPVVGMAADADGGGYWLVASDGGVFTFGNVPYLGSMGDKFLAQPVVGMAATPDGHGYWLVASDGGVFSYGDAPFYGSQQNQHLNAPIDGIEATQDGDGYWLIGSDVGVFSFGGAAFMGAHPQTPSV